MPDNIVEKLAQKERPRTIEGAADLGVQAIATSPQQTGINVADFLASQNRRYRREFARKNSIFVAGSNKPVINTRQAK